MMIRNTVAEAFIVCRITTRIASRLSDRRSRATHIARNAPTDDASTGVKKPVYMPPMVMPTTATKGNADISAARRSAHGATGPAGPVSGFRNTV